MWNTDTKAAYGNDDDNGDDEKNCLKRFGDKDYSGIDIDQAAVDKDIQDRIEFDGKGKVGKLKTMADVDWSKLENEESEPVENAYTGAGDKEIVTQNTIVIDNFLKKPFSIDAELDSVDIRFSALRSKVEALKGKNVNDTISGLSALMQGDMETLWGMIERMIKKALESR